MANNIKSHRNLVVQSKIPSSRWRTRNLTPFVDKKPKPFELIQPRSAKAIVYPWLSTEAKWQELLYSLRSVHTHFTDSECPIYIIGDKAPSWLAEGGRVQFIEIGEYRSGKEPGLWKAWQIGMQIAEEVCWMNDDIYLLRETGWDDLRVALTEGRLDDIKDDLRRSLNGWRQALGNATEALLARGMKEVWRFATHTPYLFEIEKSREIFKSYFLHHKGSWVTLYHNHHQTPHTPCDPHKTMSLPSSGNERYLNHRNNGPDKRTKSHIEGMFPGAAPWEK